MVGRRRGRTGRGWDAAPPRARRPRSTGEPGLPAGGAPAGDPGEQPGPRPRRDRARRDPALEHGSGQQHGSGPQRDPAERAREICLRQLSVRPRTRAELMTTLRRHEIPESVVAEVLDRYQEVGLIDDAAFARAWVSSRHHSRGLAGRALGGELRRRGVAPEAVGEALAELDDATQLATARGLVRRRLRSTTGEPQAVVRKLVGMLARKGYPAGLAFRVVKEELAADEQTAAIAEQIDPEAQAEAAGEDP